MRRWTAALLLLLLACTEQGPPPAQEQGTPEPGPTEQAQPPPTVTVRLVAGDDPDLQSYVEGARFAAEEVVQRGDLTLRLLQAPSIPAALGLQPQAILVAGDAAEVTEARIAIEEARVPVVLMGGDLYTSRQLFRYAFQTAIPVRWQARVMASYMIEDREHTRTALVTTLDDNAGVGEAFNAAWLEEGAGLERIIAAQPGSLGSTAAELEGLDSVVFVGRATEAAQIAAGVSTLDDPPQLALSADALDVSFLTEPNRAVAGTVACYMYAWSGWADMLPRVHVFRERFAESVGHYPASLEQEGYDAVMAIADALVRTGGEGGDRLVQALESFREETYASVPVRLGPDDHVLAEESHLGLFAIEEPGELPPEEASSLADWRPIMRTFTTDGEKVNLLDRDKRIFFPFWRPKRPTPKYWRSEYGIVSRPSDPLH